MSEFTNKLDWSVCYNIETFHYYCFYYYPLFQFIQLVKALFTILFVLFSGTACATLIVSKWFHSPVQICFDKLYNENKERYEYVSFFLEELEEYYQLDHDKDEEFLQTLTNKYIYYTFSFREKDYKIIMSYNHTDESFDYYLDEKSHSLPFPFLDTVARIYSVKYNCRNIYIDNHDNTQKLIDYLNPVENTDDQETDKKNNETDGADIFYTKKTKVKTTETKKIIQNYKSISCKYKGVISEFTELIVGFDMYNSTDTMITSIDQLDNEIFYTKKINDADIFDNIKKFLSFKDFKDSIKS
jgi:hypothetical protein|tara:strand:- start:2571 stop:3467 length:897 start_codon:yes stop_codon:yes gene_type:complete